MAVNEVCIKGIPAIGLMNQLVSSAGSHQSVSQDWQHRRSRSNIFDLLSAAVLIGLRLSKTDQFRKALSNSSVPSDLSPPRPLKWRGFLVHAIDCCHSFLVLCVLGL
jgi:hypothetical protein